MKLIRSVLIPVNSANSELNNCSSSPSSIRYLLASNVAIKYNSFVVKLSIFVNDDR